MEKRERFRRILLVLGSVILATGILASFTLMMMSSDKPPLRPPEPISASSPAISPSQVQPLSVESDAEFPWPAPEPSAFYRIPHRLLSAKTFGEVADTFQEALSRAGYTQNKFYIIRSGGFVIATQLERIQPNARPVSESIRWQEDSPSYFSLDAFIHALFFASKGFYRIFVFAFTSSVAPFGDPPTRSQMQDLLAYGGTALSRQAKALPFDPGQDCLVLVYEFERGDRPPAAFRNPSFHTGKQHLVASGIGKNLYPKGGR